MLIEDSAAVPGADALAQAGAAILALAERAAAGAPQDVGGLVLDLHVATEAVVPQRP